MSPSYSCVDTCPKAPFDNLKSLGIHRRKCKSYREFEAALFTSDEQDDIDDSNAASKRYRTCSPSPQDNTNHVPVESNLPPNNTAPGQSRRFTRSQTARLRPGYRTEHDQLPDTPTALPQSTDPLVEASPIASSSRCRRQTFRTQPDAFGRFRVYASQPLTIPDANAPMAHFFPVPATNALRSQRVISEIISPCPNISVFYVLRYHWLNGDTKSLADSDYLVEEVILQPDFNPRDLIGINLRDIDNRLAAAVKDWDPNCPPSEGWKSIALSIDVPPLPVKRGKTTGTPSSIEITGFRAQTLLDIMLKAFTSNNPNTFHYEPYEEHFQPPGSAGPTQRLSGEIYTSPAMIRAHAEVQNLIIADRTCTLPRCVAAYMFSSDGMQFAAFSHVKGWPILCSFGNESKYERCKPLLDTCYQVAHIPTLPDRIQEQIAALHGGKPPSEALLTHLRRELMHAVWAALIDDKFVDAWKNGIVVLCADGQYRRVFPRILTYSADYPEKVLLAAIRNNGQCLCPRCLVKKSAASEMGTPSDMRIRTHKRRKNDYRYSNTIARARNLVYSQGRGVQSKGVEDLLKEESYVPTFNAFSRLGGLGFNFFSSLVVDLLHEVEFGVWKALFQHLIRLLHMSGGAAVAAFNQRFRRVPAFGSIIRMFANDVADMGRIAARDYKDILQCCMPVFDGLLPEVCNEPAQRLIFIFAEWHGLAKLCLHLDETLKIFKDLTINLGVALRLFAKLTEDMNVRETPKEYARRKKKDGASKARSMTKRTRPNARQNKASHQEQGDGRRICKLNLNTYKTHALGDYSRAAFIPQLKRHLLARYPGQGESDFSEDEVRNIQFRKGRMYQHKTLGINYTSYDVLRQQDLLNPSTSNCFIMMKADVGQDSNAHPFIYAKVLGVYHAHVVYHGRPARRMDFVHVRWLYYDQERPEGWEHQHLDRLMYKERFGNENLTDLFDFVDPNDIIRASHLIPNFRSGLTQKFLSSSHSIVHDSAESSNDDWCAYHVNRFADRDILMRYIGGGVGHFQQDIGNTRAKPKETDGEESDSEASEVGKPDDIMHPLDIDDQHTGDDEEGLDPAGDDSSDELDEADESDSGGATSSVEGYDPNEDWDDMYEF